MLEPRGAVVGKLGDILGGESVIGTVGVEEKGHGEVGGRGPQRRSKRKGRVLVHTNVGSHPGSWPCSPRPQARLVSDQIRVLPRPSDSSPKVHAWAIRLHNSTGVVVRRE